MKSVAQTIPLLSLTNVQSSNFRLVPTALQLAPKIAAWLGIRECILKIETTNPTGTFKDRITACLYDYFYANHITNFCHASTGNTATSLVWGLTQYSAPFMLDLFVAELQLPFHNFSNHKKLRVHVLQDATYQDAKKYSCWYRQTILEQPDLMNFKSSIRQYGNSLAYREAFSECKKKNIAVDAVCQTISDGSGLMGAYQAMHAIYKDYETFPAVYAMQPKAANPMVRCFKAGKIKYDARHSVKCLKDSRASFIRLADARHSYNHICDIVRKTKGGMQDASEKEIHEAKHTLQKLEGIDASYTSCVALAALRKEVARSHELKNKSVMVLLTGQDRMISATPTADTYIPKKVWQKRIAGF